MVTKTQEELDELKQEYEVLIDKLKELTDDELKFVSGGYPGVDIKVDLGTTYMWMSGK